MKAHEMSRIDFINAIRSDDLDVTYSHEAASMLYDFYCDMAEETGNTFEVDPIAIKRDWSEYSQKQAREEYGVEQDEDVCECILRNDGAQYVMQVNTDSYLISTY